jgi:hypothetical protein
MAPEDFPHAPAQPVARHGASGPLAHGDPETRVSAVSARKKKKLQMASGRADPGGVALFEFSSLSKAVVPGKRLGDGRTWVHTESLLRPLRRRAERTARPDRVRIRTRKPWVRLRRRLLG